jgi:hypothetical protein
MITPPSFIDYLAVGISQPRLRKGFLRKPYLRWGDYLICCQASCDTGVAIGYGFRDDIFELAKLWCEAGQESRLIAELRRDVEKLLRATASPPTSLYDLCFRYELEKTVIRDKKSKTLLRTLAIQFAFPRFHGWIAGGIGLGYHFPDLAQKLWHESQLEPRQDQAERSREAGLTIGLGSSCAARLLGTEENRNSFSHARLRDTISS